MHRSVMAWVEGQVRERALGGFSVLEVGSLNVNGSVRELFEGAYLGVDIQSGPGVDRVASGHDLPFANSSFDVALSTEMLEHDTMPWRSVVEMARVARRWLLLTARGYDERGCFPVHNHPGDHWRYSTGGMRALLEDAGLTVVELCADPEFPGVFALARVST